VSSVETSSDVLEAATMSMMEVYEWLSRLTYASREFDCLASLERGEVCPESGVLLDTQPEIPHRVWMTVATEFETILYPKTEEEARYDVQCDKELRATRQLAWKGDHSLGASVSAKWGNMSSQNGERPQASRLL